MTASVSEEQILDFSAKIGVQAKIEGLSKAHFEGIIASLDFIEDEKASLLVTALYAHRQAARLEDEGKKKIKVKKDRKTARLISEALNEIYESGGKKETAKKTLGLAKWVSYCTEVKLEWRFARN